MSLFSNSRPIPLDLIDVEREGRQRKKLNISNLIPSVRERGVMQPIILETKGDRFKLIAGERRFATCQFLELETIPAVTTDELSELDLQMIELEENERRENLTWQENCLAVLRIHRLLVLANPEKEWGLDETSAYRGYHLEHLRKLVDLGEAIEGGDKSIAECDTQSSAWTTITRRRERIAQEVLARALEVEDDLTPEDPGVEAANTAFANAIIEEQLHGTPVPEAIAQAARTTPRVPAVSPFRIIHADMIEWLSSYEGPRFNFLHVDLPYGVPLNGQAGQASFEGGGYESNPDLYWELTNAIVSNWDRFMLPSAHIMWWFSFNFYVETYDLLSTIPNMVLQKSPLIWHKTDNKGILPDPMRMARNINEPAFYGATNDRKIVKPISNTYGCPGKPAGAIHTNEKAEPMLKHFMGMFVDQHTRMLDPTCGSGSSVRSAEALGAEAAIGLEFNPEFAARAEEALRRARTMRKLSENLADEAPLTQEEE